jgi:hypothetical protein
MSGVLSTATIGNTNVTHNGTCLWRLGNPLYAGAAHVPVSLFIMTRVELESPDFDAPGEVSVFDNQTLLFSTKANPTILAAWTRSVDFHVRFDTPGNYSLRRPGFDAAVYTGFCSNGDGTMELPASDLGFKPYVPAITNDYDRLSRAKYRKYALCQWNVKLDEKKPAWQSIIFEQFELGLGERITVKLFSQHNTFPDEVLEFTPENPAQTIYTDKRINLQFSSDGFDEKEGFAVDILRDTCKINQGFFSYPYGIISDGTRPTDRYKLGLDCSWQLKFDTAGAIILSLDYFEVRPSDVFAVYELGPSKIPVRELTGSLKANYSFVVGPYTGLEIRFKSSLDQWNGTQKKNAVYGFQLRWKACVGRCRLCILMRKTYNFETSECEECPEGTILQAGDGVPTCTACKPGSFTTETECITCPAGTYSPDGQECNPCGPGEVAPANASRCSDCGTNFSAINNTCVECPEGFRRHPHQDECEQIHVPLKTEIILLYCGLGVGAILIIGGLIAFSQWRQNQEQNSDLGYQPLGNF